VALFRRLPPLPPEQLPAWRAFLDCAAVIEGGVRTLLSTLPIGRVEPAPVALGVTALRGAIEDARGWMPDWQVPDVPDLVADWHDCIAALDAAEAGLGEVEEVAASTDELEELQEAVQEVVGELDAFADAERSWRRTWRVPRDAPGPGL
jgi:hypothetical protein